MSTDSTNETPPDRRQAVARQPFQFALRSLLLLTAVVAILFSFWATFILPQERHRRFLTRFEMALEKLEKKPPPEGMTRQQWDWMLEWTVLAKDNSLAVAPLIRDYARFIRFVEETEQRVQEDASVALIDWIWDEIARVSNVDYARYRPTSPQMQKEGGYPSP